MTSELLNITLINGIDLMLAKKKIISVDKIKQVNVKTLIEPGAYKMKITETIQEKLQLPLIEKKKFTMANGSTKELDIVGPIEVKFKNRSCTLDAIIISGDNDSLTACKSFRCISNTTMDYLIADVIRL